METFITTPFAMHFIAAVTVTLAMGCSAEDTCPVGSIMDGSQCRFGVVDATFPGAQQSVTLADVASPDSTGGDETDNGMTVEETAAPDTDDPNDTTSAPDDSRAPPPDSATQPDSTETDDTGQTADDTSDNGTSDNETGTDGGDSQG